MKYYISGKISGIESAAIANFERVEKMLQSKGFETVNPMKLPHDHDTNWAAYMREDIRALLNCDGIFMQANWQDSKGARIEHEIAAALGMKFMYEDFGNPICYETPDSFLHQSDSEKLRDIKNGTHFGMK